MRNKKTPMSGKRKLGLICFAAVCVIVFGALACIKVSELKKVNQIIEEQRWVIPLSEAYTYIEPASTKEAYFIAGFENMESDTGQTHRQFYFNESGTEVKTLPDESYDQETEASQKFKGSEYKFIEKEDEQAYITITVCARDGKELRKTPYNEINIIYDHLYLATDPKRLGNNDYCVFLGEDFKPTFRRNIFKDVGQFSEEKCYCKRMTNGNYDKLPKKGIFESGFINERGEMVISTPGSIYASDFSEGKSIVYTKSEVYCIDDKGGRLFEMNLKEKLRPESQTDYEKEQIIGQYHQGRAVIFDGTSFGIVDARGKWVIEPVFDKIKIVKDCYGVINYKDKWGLIKF